MLLYTCGQTCLYELIELDLVVLPIARKPLILKVNQINFSSIKVKNIKITDFKPSVKTENKNYDVN